MHSNNPELLRWMTAVLDEIIPTMPVDEGMPALITQIGDRILEAAAEGRASYESLLAVASAEAGTLVLPSRVIAPGSRSTERDREVK